MPKCRICGNTVNKNCCFIVTKTNKSGKSIREFYCSEYEYDGYIRKLSEQKELRDKWYKFCCDFFDVPNIINTAFWKETAKWKTICTENFDLIMCGFFESNAKKFNEAKIKIKDNMEYSKIKYFSAIVCNSLQDYCKKRRTETLVPVSEEKLDGNIPDRVENVNTKSRRRSLEDIEELL